MTCSALRAMGLVGSLTMAKVVQPWRRPSSMTLRISGDWPDWEMPMTSASRRSGGIL